MENYSYPDSGNSSPLSREVDCENASFDDLNNSSNSNYKVKFMCSYGGKILPRPHDNQLTYVGGDTKILTVDRNIRFSSILHRLNSLSDSDVCFKYQLPGEDLDALISVTNEEDLEHMMLEYDRLCRASVKPARLRLFLFPLTMTSSITPASSFGLSETKSDQQWFVDALNSVQISNTEGSSPASVENQNPDFLFGFDKGHGQPAKVQDVNNPAPAPQIVNEVFAKEVLRAGTGSECGSEDRHVIGDPVEIQRQIQELQRLQIATQEQQQAIMLQRKSDEIIINPNPRSAYYGDYYAQKINPQPPQPAETVQAPQYWQEQRHMPTTGGYESPGYLITTSAGVYQTQTPAMPPPAQAYYGMQQPLYNQIQPQPIQQQQKIGTYPEAIGMVRPPVSTRVGLAHEQGYAQVGYDGAGRQVYYTTQGGVVPSYQAVVTAAEMRQGGGGLVSNQDGKSVGNAKAS